VQFSLKFDAAAIKLDRVSLTGTTLNRLGWSVQSSAGRGLVSVSLSGSRALAGTGKLLSFALASATGKTVSATIACVDTQVNGQPVTIAVSGGSVEVTAGAGTGIVFRPPVTTLPGPTTDTTTKPTTGTTRPLPGTTTKPTTTTPGATRPTPTTGTTPGTTTTTPSVLERILGGGKTTTAAPLSLTLPSGRVSSGKATSILYSVNAGAEPITSINFQLKYDTKALKTPALSLSGTTPQGLGWKLQVNTRTAGTVAISLSGTKALTGRGTLLSITLTSATGKTVTTKLQCASTQVNGKTATIPASGGSVEVTAAISTLRTMGPVTLPR
jgi:hypothetical protein